MRTAGVALVALLVAAAALASGRSPGTDETPIFTGGEEVAAGRSVRPPQVRYWKVRASLAVAAGGPVRATMLVPVSDGRQDVLVRRTVAPGFRFGELEEAPNLRVEWTAERTAGSTLTYEVAVRIAETTVAAPHVPVRGLAVPTGLSIDRIKSRNELLRDLDQTFRTAEANSPLLEGLDRFSQKASEMILSDRSRLAFDVSQESPAIRKLFEADDASQALLLAGRLVEYCVRFVTVTHDAWDTHLDNFTSLKKQIKL